MLFRSVYSARYCGRHGDDEANNDKLLDAMQAVPAGQRGAKFVSAVCFILPDGRHLTCMGECPGSIAFERPVSYTHLDVYKRQLPGRKAAGHQGPRLFQGQGHQERHPSGKDLRGEDVYKRQVP